MSRPDRATAAFDRYTEELRNLSSLEQQPDIPRPVKFEAAKRVNRAWREFNEEFSAIDGPTLDRLTRERNDLVVIGTALWIGVLAYGALVLPFLLPPTNGLTLIALVSSGALIIYGVGRYLLEVLRHFQRRRMR